MFSKYKHSTFKYLWNEEKKENFFYKLFACKIYKVCH